MRKIMLIACLLAASLHSAHAVTVTCPEARWPGVGVHFDGDEFAPGEDGITLKEMVYQISGGKVVARFGEQRLDARIQNAYTASNAGYLVVVYNYGNVTNVDTLHFPSGVVFSYVTKLSLNIFPYSVTYYRKCQIGE